MIIKNETIKKLTAKELNDLGIWNYGMGCYNGMPKSRVKGYKTTCKTETEVHYTNIEHDTLVFEAVKTVDGSWILRRFDFDKNGYDYETMMMPLFGINFFKC